MFANEMLVRTLNAEHEAREKGFTGFANALNEIKVNLSNLVAPQSDSEATYSPVTSAQD